MCRELCSVEENVTSIIAHAVRTRNERMKICSEKYSTEMRCSSKDRSDCVTCNCVTKRKTLIPMFADLVVGT